MEEIEKIYRELIDKENFAEWSFDKAIQSIGVLVDISCDLSKADGLNHAIKQADILLSKNLSEMQKSTIYYFAGNAWSGLRALKHSNTKAVWDWQQTEIENEILNFRLFNRCLTSDKNSSYFCQANTNLGNTLSHVGRFIDAIMYWDAALKCNPSFGMALANKGYGLISYARSLYDNGHVGIFLKFAYSFLKRGLETKEVHLGARKVFDHAIEDIETRTSKRFLEEALDMNSHTLGDSEAEKKYRKWCLNNQLFVNPLNDLGPYNIAARDVLSCPSITTSIDDGSYFPPVYFTFYNQLKQEYGSARYLFYESLQTQEPHYSDSDVQLYNTLDYPCYGLNIEKAKIVFRMAYSIFDKIAYFINEYLKLRAPETKVSFKTIWYEKQKKHEGLRKEFVDFENWPLRGLFWLAKDLSENRSEFYESMEPDAKDLVKTRNYLEHKYLTITEYDMSTVDEKRDNEKNKIYVIQREEFVLKTLRLMKLARAALIYLSLGIHIEERKKTSKVDGIITSMPLDIWEDDWKV
ncbi:MAG: LA2681 family HEPN domain-containing protein [Sedimentisphaerales bacterium]